MNCEEAQQVIYNYIFAYMSINFELLAYRGDINTIAQS